MDGSYFFLGFCLRAISFGRYRYPSAITTSPMSFNEMANSDSGRVFQFGNTLYCKQTIVFASQKKCKEHSQETHTSWKLQMVAGNNSLAIPSGKFIAQRINSVCHVLHNWFYLLRQKFSHRSTPCSWQSCILSHRTKQNTLHKLRNRIQLTSGRCSGEKHYKANTFQTSKIRWFI